MSRAFSAERNRFQTGAVDVDQFQMLDDAVHRQPPGQCPVDDFEVVVPVFHPIEDAIAEDVVFHDELEDLAEFVLGELGPPLHPFDVFEPLPATEGEPVSTKPVLQSRVTQVASLLLAFDPFMPQGLFQSR